MKRPCRCDMLLVVRDLDALAYVLHGVQATEAEGLPHAHSILHPSCLAHLQLAPHSSAPTPHSVPL